jgi:hypothetical protein
VWIALGLSALSLLACVALVVWLGIRRRRKPVALDPDTVAPAPLLISPAARRGRTPGLFASILVPIVALVVGGLLVTPVVGALMAVVAILAVRFRKLRPALSLGAPALVMLCGVYIAVQQYRYAYAPRFEWPTFFERINVLGWIAVLLVALDALIDFVRDRQKPAEERRGYIPVKPIDEIPV